MSDPFQQQSRGAQDHSPPRRLICKACDQLFTDPLLLPCLHTLCRGCLSSLIQEGSSERSVKCPSCGERAAGVDFCGAVPNRLACRLAEEAKAEERAKEMKENAEKQDSIRCQSCGTEEKKVEGFCQDCSLYICRECIGHHSLLPITQNHTIVPLDAVPFLQTTLSSVEPSPAHCPIHGTYVLDLYCAEPSCLTPICFKCTVSQHKGHNCIPIEDVDMEKQASWLKSLASITQSNISATERANDRMQRAISLLDVRCTEAHHKVRQCADRLRKAVDDHEHNLHEQIDAMRLRRMEIVRAQQSANTSLLDQLQQAKETVEEVSRKATCVELLATARIVARHILRLGAQCAAVEPLVHISHSVDLLEAATVEALIAQVGEFGYLSEGPHLPNCAVSHPATLHVDECRSMAQFTVVIADRHKNLCSRGGDHVAAYLRSLATPSPPIRAEVTDNSDGTYTVTLKQFYLDQCGLRVTVNGQAISEQPAVVTVKTLPRRNYTEICKAKGELKFPRNVKLASLCGICIAQNGRICVSDRDKHVVYVFDRHRVYVRTIGGAGNEHGQLCSPRGLSVSGQGELFIACQDRIDVLTLEGTYLRRFGTTGEGQIDGAFDVAVAMENNKVFVANTIKRTVTAFSRNGKFLYNFDPTKPVQLKHPTGIAVSACGKVYVSDQSSRCLQVFSTAGKHIQQIGGLSGTENPTTPGHLLRPNNLAIIPGGYLLVPEISNNRVSIFTLKGEFVHCFGGLRADSECFRFPFAVAVGDDEIVYVTECDGRRVQYF